jgi:hypothetical protein
VQTWIDDAEFTGEKFQRQVADRLLTFFRAM